MTAFATAADVVGRWRPLTAAEEAQAEVLLDDASDLIRFRVPDVDARIAAGDLPATIAKQVAVAMVKRVMKNPNGLISEQIDDYSYRRADGGPNGELELTDDEESMLSGQPVGAFTIRAPAVPWCAR